MKFVRGLIDGILAGIMITIGCSVFVACSGSGNKYIGAILFSVALITICYMGYSLFTGKIGFILENNNKTGWTVLLTGLLGNAIATAFFGYIVGLALPGLQETAQALVLAKLPQTFLETFVRAIFCGILMYIAVLVYREKKNIVGIVFCIPVFILCGFEHSIADMGYFALGHVASFESLDFILIVIIGNTVGGLLFPVLKLIGKEKQNG